MLFTNAPFGGYKSSGVGKELGKYALMDYVSTKGIFIRYVALLYLFPISCADFKKNPGSVKGVVSQGKS
jgi:hypothetical protein